MGRTYDVTEIEIYSSQVKMVKCAQTNFTAFLRPPNGTTSGRTWGLKYRIVVEHVARSHRFAVATGALLPNRGYCIMLVWALETSSYTQMHINVYAWVLMHINIKIKMKETNRMLLPSTFKLPKNAGCVNTAHTIRIRFQTSSPPPT